MQHKRSHGLAVILYSQGRAEFSGLAPALSALLSNRGTLDVDLRGNAPVVAGGRGDVGGSYDNTGYIILSLYGNWTF